MITENMTIAEILSTYPETLPVFTSHGMEKFEDTEVVAKLGALLKLKTALKVKGFDTQLFVDKLTSAVVEHRKWNGRSVGDAYGKSRLTVLGMLPCGLKMPFIKAFEAFAQEYNEKHGKVLDYIVEGNVNHETSYYSYIDSVETAEELPDVIISSDINAFFHRRFTDQFIDNFLDVSGYSYNEDYAAVGFQDPGGQYTMLSANLLVMLVDDKLIGDLPYPKSWSDLMKPEYENTVSIRGDGTFFCNGVLMPYYKEFGIDGIKAMERSVCTGMHPAEMVKQAGTGKGKAAIHVLPYFFAKTKRQKGTTTIVWPEDGALISPVTMLVKSNKVDEVKEITDFFTGTKLGGVCAKSLFPSVNPEVENAFDESRKMKWLGWDYLKNNDISEIKQTIKANFKPF